MRKSRVTCAATGLLRFLGCGVSFINKLRTGFRNSSQRLLRGRKDNTPVANRGLKVNSPRQNEGAKNSYRRASIDTGLILERKAQHRCLVAVAVVVVSVTVVGSGERGFPKVYYK